MSKFYEEISDFEDQIREFHRVFGLPQPTSPQIPELERLFTFKRMVLNEIEEGEEVLLAVLNKTEGVEHPTVLMADWLGDIIVYAASEMVRHGLPVKAVLGRIMESQFTKLDKNGKPIIFNGKIKKGPDFVPPEAEIAKLLEGLRHG